MFKIRNETRIALLAIAALALAIWGFKFLKGINILTASKTFYVRYNNVDQLRPSSPVFINGFQVGMVKDMYVDQADDRTIIAVLNIDRGVDVPKNTRATIIGLSLMGGKAIELQFDQPCNGADCAESGDYLQGAAKSFMQSLVGDPRQLDAYMERLQVGLTAIYDSIADPRDPQGFGRTLVALQHSLTNIVAMTDKINRMLDLSTAGMASTVNNTAEITRTIRDGNQNIASLLANLDAVSKQLKDASLDISAGKANTALDSVTTSLAALRQTLVATQKTIGKVDALAENLVKGKGTAGKLLNDEQLYDNLVRASQQIQLLTQDLRLNPKRYTTVKLKIFGKNKTKGYVNPIDDPFYQGVVDSLERDYIQKIKQ